MVNVIDIDSARPHRTASVECKRCNYKWQAVYPETANKLECPGCHGFVNEYGTSVSVSICKSCKREFSVCPPTDWEFCLAEDCKSYDPACDVDYLFDE